MVYVYEGPIKLRLSGSPVEVGAINDDLRYRTENYWRADSYQIWKRSGGKVGWDGYKRPINRVRGSRTTWMSPRGWLDDILNSAEKLNISVNLDNLIERPFGNLTADDLPDDLICADFALDGDQSYGICQWLSNGFGVVQATVSAGKTAMFCGAYAYIKRKYPEMRALYLTPTERLVRQVTAESRKFLPDLEIGQYGGGKHEKDAKDLVVATSAIIGRHMDELSQSWLKSFGVLLCDESHHAAGATMQKILETVPAFFRFGASDTTKEDNAEAFAIIKGLLGPIRHRVDVEPLINIGRVARPSIYLVDVPTWQNKYAALKHTPETGSSAWLLHDGHWIETTYDGPSPLLDEEGNVRTHKVKVPVLDSDGNPAYRNGFPVKEEINEPLWNEGWHLLTDKNGKLYEAESRWCLLDRVYDQAIILNKDRNKLIADWAASFSGQGKQTLVVCTRTLHILLLERLIKDRLNPDLVRILFSVHASKERDETFDWLRKTPGAVLITPLVKEGVSINEIKAGVVADHVVSYEVARQIIGRYIRKKKEGTNTAEIVWFIDRQHPRLRHNSLKLFDELKRIRGYTFYHPCCNPGDLTLATRYEEVDAS